MTPQLCTHYSYPPENPIYDIPSAYQPDGVSPISEIIQVEGQIFTLYPKETWQWIDLSVAQMAPVADPPPGLPVGYASWSQPEQGAFVGFVSKTNPENLVIVIPNDSNIVTFPSFALHLCYGAPPLYPIGSYNPNWRHEYVEGGGGMGVSFIAQVPHSETENLPYHIDIPVLPCGLGGGYVEGETYPLPPESTQYYEFIAFNYGFSHPRLGLKYLPKTSVIPALSAFAFLGVLGGLGWTPLVGKT